jgi:Arc/MetJ family transcription regulator
VDGFSHALHGRNDYVYKITIYTPEAVMRTNIEIDDKLLAQAIRLTGLKTKRAAVEAGLKMLVRVKRQEEILKLRGKVHWEGNIDDFNNGTNT